MKYSANEEQLYHIGLSKGSVGRYVILPGDPGRVEKIARYFDDPYMLAENREFVTWNGTLEGELVSCTSTGIGGPSATIAMTELAYAGADSFFRIGTCGGMQQNILSGDIVIANGAIRMEGTSKEIAPIEYPAVPDFDLLCTMAETARKGGWPAHVGVVQCKDTFYGQHSPENFPGGYDLINKWQAWVRMGCLASEMESAALFITAAALGVRCASCFLVMANQEREKAGLPNPVVHDTDSAIRLTIETIRSQIRKDREQNVSQQ